MTLIKVSADMPLTALGHCYGQLNSLFSESQSGERPGKPFGGVTFTSSGQQRRWCNPAMSTSLVAIRINRP